MQVVILANAPSALIELCGTTLLERLLRTLQRVGVREAVVISETPEVIAAELDKVSPPRSGIEVKLARERIAEGDLRLTLPGDAVWDARLLRLLLAQEQPSALANFGMLTGATVSRGDGELKILEIAEQPTYSLVMRRDLPLLWIPAPESAERKTAERRILDAAQKGSQDLPALLHAPIENFSRRAPLQDAHHA